MNYIERFLHSIAFLGIFLILVIATIFITSSFSQKKSPDLEPNILGTASTIVNLNTPSVCGNGVREHDEECDKDDMGQISCRALGFQGGDISCNPNCTNNTSLCGDDFDSVLCGNGVLDPGEQCDGLAFGSGTCSTYGFDEGALGCDTNCRLDKSECILTSAVVPGEGEVSKIDKVSIEYLPETGEEDDGPNIIAFALVGSIVIFVTVVGSVAVYLYYNKARSAK